MAEQIQALRRYEITFLGHNAEGTLPMRTITEGVTRKAAIQAFVAQYRPTGGWFLGDAEDVTEREQQEEADNHREQTGQ